MRSTADVEALLSSQPPEASMLIRLEPFPLQVVHGTRQGQASVFSAKHASTAEPTLVPGFSFGFHVGLRRNIPAFLHPHYVVNDILVERRKHARECSGISFSYVWLASGEPTQQHLCALPGSTELLLLQHWPDAQRPPRLLVAIEASETGELVVPQVRPWRKRVIACEVLLMVLRNCSETLGWRVMQKSRPKIYVQCLKAVFGCCV